MVMMIMMKTRKKNRIIPSILFGLSLSLWQIPSAQSAQRIDNHSKPRTNIFANGCLKVMEERKKGQQNNENLDGPSKIISSFDERVCNSDDKLLGKNNCRKPTFDNYVEVRIAASWVDACTYTSTLYTLSKKMCNLNFVYKVSFTMFGFSFTFLPFFQLW